MKRFQEFPILKTERLILREIIPSDAQALFRIFGDHEVMKYNVPQHVDVLDSERVIEEFAEYYRLNEGISWGVALKSSDVVIGTCMFHQWDKQHRRAAIGYDLARVYWGQGIIPEALRAVIKFGFEQMDLHRITAEVSAANSASLRVVEKLGFKQEGVLEEHYFEEGKFNDELLFGLLKRNYHEGQSR